MWVSAGLGNPENSLVFETVSMTGVLGTTNHNVPLEHEWMFVVFVEPSTHTIEEIFRF